MKGDISKSPQTMRFLVSLAMTDKN